MSRRKKQIKPYDIPDNVLNVLNEHCYKGFMLFTLDPQENFRLYCNFDDSTTMKALKSDISNWMDTMKHVEMQSTLHGILGQNGNNEQEG